MHYSGQTTKAEKDKEGGFDIREFDEHLPYNSRILIIEEQFRQEDSVKYSNKLGER